MKTLKITLAVLISFAVSAISFAGELTVTGSAKATYSIRAGESTTAALNSGKGIGIANEFSLGASGEAAGVSWTYRQDIDGATVQDDAQIALTYGSYGTVAINVSEGGNSSKYKWDTNVYAPGSDYGFSGSSAVSHKAGLKGSAWTNGNDIGQYANVQYHTPDGLLPSGTAVKIAFAPTAAKTENNSSNGSGAAATDGAENAYQVQVSSAPVEGLALSASYYQEGMDRGTTSANDYEAYGIAGKYAVGPFTVGLGQFHVVPASAKATAKNVRYFDNRSYGVSFNVNEALAVSYGYEESIQSSSNADENKVSNTSTQVKSEIQALQAAYTIGGMTLSIANKEIDNFDYTEAKNASETVLSMALAF